MKCLKCGGEDRRKYGTYNGRQKWQCKDCLHVSYLSSPRGAPPEIIKMALRLVLEGLSFCATARFITDFGYKCSENAVIGWVNKYADKIRSLEAVSRPKPRVIEIDEMHTYIKKELEANAGCGGLFVAIRVGPLPQELVIVRPKV